MKTNKEIKDQDLNNIAGGHADLEKYLKNMHEKEKDKTLVDFEIEPKLELNPTIKYEKDGNVEIILRDKPDCENVK